jgi:hypothetical protein
MPNSSTRRAVNAHPKIRPGCFAPFHKQIWRERIFVKVSNRGWRRFSVNEVKDWRYPHNDGIHLGTHNFQF